MTTSPNFPTHNPILVTENCGLHVVFAPDPTVELTALLHITGGVGLLSLQEPYPL